MPARVSRRGEQLKRMNRNSAARRRLHGNPPARKLRGHRAFALAAQSRGVRIVNVVENASAGLIDQLRKHFFDSREIGIEVEVFFLDVQDECALG